VIKIKQPMLMVDRDVKPPEEAT